MVVEDWFSRYIVSWTLSDTLELPFVLEAARQALTQATPAIWNTDQGSQFTSSAFTQLLTDAKVRISMDGKGRALDNVRTERLWRTIKYDHVYLHDYGSPREARQQLGDFLHTYNQRRLHEALDYRTPRAVHDGAACEYVDNAAASLRAASALPTYSQAHHQGKGSNNVLTSI